MPDDPLPENVIAAALREVFGPLVKLAQALPPALSYSLATVIAVVAAVILRAVFPIEIVVFLGVIVLAGLVAFVWMSRKRTAPVRRSRITLFVVVHQEKDTTHFIPGAKVILALPEPQVKQTGDHGEAVFASIPGEYAGRTFDIKASHPDFLEPDHPRKWKIEPDASIYLALAPRPPVKEEKAAPREAADAQPARDEIPSGEVQREQNLRTEAVRATEAVRRTEAVRKYYYCYISAEKVDQILSQYSANKQGSVEAVAEKFKEGKSDLSAKILENFESGGAYGNPSSLMLFNDQRKSLVTRLLAALQCIEDEHGKLPSLNETIAAGGPVHRGAYMYYGEFRVAKFDDRFAYLESSPTEPIKVKLSCSLRYFFSVYEKGEEFYPHSGNVMFFNGEVNVAFQSLLYVLQVKEGLIYATPVFLGLPLDSALLL